MTPPSTRRTMTMGDDQANVEPPLEMEIRINTVAISNRKLPKKSIFLSFDLNDPVTGLSGRKKMTWIRDRTLTGAVIQNTHLHCRLDSTKKKSKEDSTEERPDCWTCGYPDTCICHHLSWETIINQDTFPRVLKVLMSLIMINTRTPIPPPPSPAITRNAINSVIFLENPHNRFPIVNTVIAKISSIFLPKISDNLE